MALGIESELVGSQIKDAGLYGAIISVLLATIMGLLAYIRSLHRTAAKIYAYRLTERDSLRDALHESRAAILSQAESSNERNRLMEELTRTIQTSNAQMDTLNALLKLQFEFLKDDYGRLNQVIGAMADGIRTLSSTSQSIQSGIQTIQDRTERLISRGTP